MKVVTLMFAVVALSCQSASAALVNIGDFFKGTSVVSAYSANVGTVQAVTSDIPPGWSPPTTDWINNGGFGSSALAPGSVTYTTTFNLAALTPGTLTAITPFSFDVAADNDVTVIVNGSSVISIANAFSTLTSISPTLIAGMNTITFVVTNAGSEANPSGLLVTNIQGSYDDEFVVPEPASIALWGGAVGLGLLVRRRKK